jgi:oxepin-CoA hydrolase/3-oxo-5,6-dehydrosuberyl-CoA semialdehyde dehydrogenase
MKLQTHRVFARESVRFIAERDSLNASILGPDAAPGTPEFDLFVKEIAREMTVKGRAEMHRHPPRHRAEQHMDAVQEALSPARQGGDRRSLGRRA